MNPDLKSAQSQTEIIPQWQLNEQILSSTIEYFQSRKRVGNIIVPHQIMESLKLIPFFTKNCPKGQELNQFILEALNHMSYEQYNNGQAVINIGEYGDKAYIILSGSVNVYIRRSQELISKDQCIIEKIKEQILKSKFKKVKLEPQNEEEDQVLLLQFNNEFYWKDGVPLFQKVHEYNSGDHFGEVALESNKPRTASILVQSKHLHCLTMSRSGYRQVCLKTEDSLQIIEYFLKIFPEEMLFQVSRFVKHLDTISFSSQQQLWAKNDQPEYFFFIISGRVELFYINKDQDVSPTIFSVKLKKIVVGQYTDGNVVGLSEILSDDQRRKYNCKCRENTQGYYITKAQYNKFKQQNSEINQHLIQLDNKMQRAISEREQQVNNALNDYQRELTKINKKGKPMYEEDAQLISKLRKAHIIRSNQRQLIQNNQNLKILKKKNNQLEASESQKKQIDQILYPQLREQVIRSLTRNQLQQKRRNGEKLERNTSMNKIKQFSIKQSQSIEKYIVQQDDTSLIQVKSLNQLDLEQSFTPRQVMLKARSQSKSNLANQIYKNKIQRVLSNYENIKTESTLEDLTIHNTFRQSPKIQSYYFSKYSDCKHDL